MVGTEGPAVDGAIAAKCRGEIWRSTEGGSVVAGAATAVDMAGEQARSVYTHALLEVEVVEGKSFSADESCWSRENEMLLQFSQQ